MKNLFIVANRLPVSVQDAGAGLTIQRSTGGLVAALSSYLFGQQKNQSFNKIYWAGAPCSSAALWEKAEPELKGHEYDYLPVYMPRRTYDGYYKGMSNSMIWPLFHYFASFAEYNTEDFDHYIKANKAFLDALLGQLSPGDTVWIHDYHLMPLAGMLRAAMPSLSIGFFLHIPFPSYELFRTIPRKWQEQIMHGLLGADIIGFQTIDYAAHFMKCAQMILGLDDDMHVLRYRNRLVKVDVFPISIDYEQFNSSYDDPEVIRLRGELRSQFEGKKIIFSADRLDYTKGVYDRLRAYELFLMNNPEYREQVQFVLIVVPSRDNMSRYAERKKMIDEYIGDINSRVGSINWQPVIYRYANLDHQELSALYTGCDLALITPLRDGMNLVAKEFVASRKDGRGVLVLSELAGAAKELSDALMINPNDHEETAAMIRMGLEMNAAEQTRRITAMQRRIALYDIHAWAADFLKQLSLIKQRQKAYEVKFADDSVRSRLVDHYAGAGKRLLLLDYDGTLVPLSPVPSDASPGHRLRLLLSHLCADPANDVYIISGRDSHTLEHWLGQLPLCMIAEHGARFRAKTGHWIDQVLTDQDWQLPVRQIMNCHVKRCPQSFMEAKGYSLAWHYRNVHPDQAKLRSAELYAELLNYARHHGLHVVHGNKVIEVRNQGVDKGAAVRKLLRLKGYDFILAFGDDATDEDMFQVLQSYYQAFTFKVGNAASFARYNVPEPGTVMELLSSISRLPRHETVQAMEAI